MENSCENLDLDSLSDCEYVKHGLTIWINNEPQKAIEFLDKRRDVLSVEFGSVLLRFFNALISFDRCRIAEASSLLRALERKCSPPEQGWFRSIKSKLFGTSDQQRELTCRKSILFELEREIILADVLLCSSILIGVSCDVSSYIKSALILRRTLKIYNQTMKGINELCNQYFDKNDTTLRTIKGKTKGLRLEPRDFPPLLTFVVPPLRPFNIYIFHTTTNYSQCVVCS